MSFAVNLTGVPETLLWTLHNRASEAMRSDGILRDPEAVRIYENIQYDFIRNFGKPNGTHARRSRVFDEALRPWMAAHPGGTVVELACGLETQFQRCDDGKVRWLCVDLPESIDVRARFLPESMRCRYLRKSALDLSWLEEVDSGKGVFITAQGLFMYFEEKEVRHLVSAIFERLPSAELMFDVIPRWFSRRAIHGVDQTKYYRSPPMLWGINRGEIAGVLRSWSPKQVVLVEILPFGGYRGLSGHLLPVISAIPVLREIAPCVVRVRCG